MKVVWDKSRLAMGIQCESEQEFQRLREILSEKLECNWEIYEE